MHFSRTRITKSVERWTSTCKSAIGTTQCKPNGVRLFRSCKALRCKPFMLDCFNCNVWFVAASRIPLQTFRFGLSNSEFSTVQLLSSVNTNYSISSSRLIASGNWVSRRKLQETGMENTSLTIAFLSLLFLTLWLFERYTGICCSFVEIAANIG